MSQQPPDLAAPYFMYIRLPQYAQIGTDSAGNDFCFYIPRDDQVTGSFIEYRPEVPQLMTFDRYTGLPSRLQVEVTANAKGFGLNGTDWSVVFEVLH